MATETVKKPVILFCNQHSYMLRIPITETDNGKKETVMQKDGNGNFELNVYNRRITAKKDIPFMEFTRMDSQGKPVSATDWWCNLVVTDENPDKDAILAEFERLHKKAGSKLFTEEEYRVHCNPEAAAVEKRIKAATEGEIRVANEKLAQTQSELEKYKKMYEDAKNRR